MRRGQAASTAPVDADNVLVLTNMVTPAAMQDPQELEEVRRVEAPQNVVCVLTQRAALQAWTLR